MNSQEDKQEPTPARPAVSYWDDPVYHYPSRQHHSALDAEDDRETARFDKFMQELVNQSMSDEQYWQFDEEANVLCWTHHLPLARKVLSLKKPRAIFARWRRQHANRFISCAL